MTVRWIELKPVKECEVLTLEHKDGPASYPSPLMSFKGYYEYYEDGKLVALRFVS